MHCQPCIRNYTTGPLPTSTRRGGTRFSPPLICSFIEQMRARKFRVESICRVLTEQGVAVAGRTYRSWKKAAPSAHTITDGELTDALRATVGTPEGLYGRRKMTAHLRRQGRQVAACTVDRLMSDEGLSGVVRAASTAPRSVAARTLVEHRICCTGTSPVCRSPRGGA